MSQRFPNPLNLQKAYHDVQFELHQFDETLDNELHQFHLFYTHHRLSENCRVQIGSSQLGELSCEHGTNNSDLFTLAEMCIGYESIEPSTYSVKKRHNKKTKKVATIPHEEPLEDKLAPHSFVISRGVRNRNVQHICHDLRKVMEPYTATHLKERRCNKIKDFVSLSGIFHVSNMCIFTQTETALSLKIARMPKGPTLTFKVHQYTLSRDVLSSMKTQFFDEDCYHFAPIVILNGFSASGDAKHMKLMTSTFQNMFPAINLSTVKLSNVKRCVLFSFNPVTKLIDIRHYYIRPQPIGINKGVKKLVNRQIPDLSKFDDISEFVTKAELLSGSEYEDEEKTVVMPATIGRGNIKENKSAIKLYELGPRLTIQLIKIEEGMMSGDIFFHEYVTKTEEEVKLIKARRDKRKRLKEQRKLKMQQNVKAKEQAKQKAKQKGNDDEQMEVENDDENCYHFAPIVILNGFSASGDAKHMKLMTSTFQNMFPAINLSTVKLSNVKRCVLFSFNPVTKLIDIRHYYIRPQPVGINKGVKKLVNRQIPDLSKFDDISEFVTKAELLSGSEYEDEEKTVVMPATIGRGNIKENKSAIKLYELGPRLTIQLIKIEEGMMSGDIFFHEYVTKTEEEVKLIKARRDKRKRLKEQRKLKMQQNVKAKEQAKQKAKQKGNDDEKMEDENDDESDREDNSGQEYNSDNDQEDNSGNENDSN
uniref:CSON012370 protein n=1 Tax=Culicoides sonorensis TaxID=179676 RepID=A0A336KW58_CULSO